MTKLWILYDNRCGLCTRLRFWASTQPAFVEMCFVAAGSAQAIALFPSLQQPGQPDQSLANQELLVIDDRGGVYANDDAWMMCLWALEDYREWAVRLSASPALKGMARQAYSMISRQRYNISSTLGLMSEEQLAQRLRAEPVTCSTPAAPVAMNRVPRTKVNSKSEIADALAPGYFSER